jgi:PKD repeat protein
MKMCRRIWLGWGVLIALAGIACDRVPLLAPTNSTVTINAQTHVVPIGGTTEVSAMVIESSGTPVQNGTTVRFTTTLGRVDPVEAQTKNGLAVTTFYAGNDSGIAEVRATSGGIGGGTTTTPSASGNGSTTTTTTSSTNVVQISVGAAAVDSVTVRVNPAVVSANGGTVTVSALVVGQNGRLLEGIRVSFTASHGTLSSTTALTDGNGEARVTLTTNADTNVTATAGSKTSEAAKVTAQPGPSVTLTCAVGATTNCATVTVGQAVSFTAQRAQGSSVLTSSTLDFGDGASVNLGNLSSTSTVSHTYTQAGSFTARLTATDVNGETTTSTQVIQVVASASLTLTLQNPSGRLVDATANLAAATATQFSWTWESGATDITSTNTNTHTYTTAGTKTVSVTATLSDGRTLTAVQSITLP